ncbi:hypothetical protein AVEN_58334-1 [Araneus ventricosus]|uniref:Uncharacterized protein n=1 Tax=Araneus ventricosus TaxID=182803 RepID=A0A4Y2CQU5_ARAVE|nr:hypothetical protein AVEN_58334-1 [Araneus ventricosus]
MWEEGGSEKLQVLAQTPGIRDALSFGEQTRIRASNVAFGNNEYLMIPKVFGGSNVSSWLPGTLSNDLPANLKSLAYDVVYKRLCVFFERSSAIIIAYKSFIVV